MIDVRHPTEAVPLLVARLYEIVSELEALFPGRRFTPDGHLVGSIGEVMAAYRYNLELLPASTPCHDATSPCGRLVQVKATQGGTVGMREEPSHLIVLHLSKEGQVTEVFNGPGSLAWAAAGVMQRNGQRPISLSKLRALMKEVAPDARLQVRGA